MKSKSANSIHYPMNNPSVIKFRLFGAHDCKDCIKLSKALQVYAIDFEFLDSNDSKSEHLFDDRNIEKMPYLEAYRVSDGKILFHRIGYVSPLVLLRDVSAALKELHSPTDLHLKGVSPTAGAPTKPTSTVTKGCGGCNNAAKNSRSQ